jgi:dipeptidyl aminopeptidase/acylaminoacyl peptidase
MGIYQRNLENYTQSPVIENKMTDNNCMNCHSFCMQNPEKMLFHIRGSLASTILLDGDKIERLNTKTTQTMSALVYPSWHPGGRYIAFSVNDTKQAYHMNARNRVEVFDYKSDVVVYDTEKHEIITTPLLFSEGRMETFPSFSPDGKTLYFCTADTCKMPDEFAEVKYSLCSIAFDPETRRFGTHADTLFQAEENGMSASFPRVSPDGNYLLYTKAAYGNFSIWHKDADLWLIALASGKHSPLEAANSPDVESYHSWSSNSRWVVFSSRRLDGLYTRLYITYMDADGQAGKPFLVPQKKVGFYHELMKSYNIPEFITGKVKEQGYRIGRTAKKEKGIDVSFGKIK